MHKRGQFYTYNEGTGTYADAGGSVEPSSLGMSNTVSGHIVQQYSLNYENDFGDHHLSAMAMYEATLMNNEYFWTQRQEFKSTIIEELFAGDESTAKNTSSSNNYGRNSYIGRLNYSYADKYMVEATVRADASSRFAEGYRWGWPPAEAQ